MAVPEKFGTGVIKELLIHSWFPLFDVSQQHIKPNLCQRELSTHQCAEFGTSRFKHFEEAVDVFHRRSLVRFMRPTTVHKLP